MQVIKYVPFPRLWFMNQIQHNIDYTARFSHKIWGTLNHLSIFENLWLFAAFGSKSFRPLYLSPFGNAAVWGFAQDACFPFFFRGSGSSWITLRLSSQALAPTLFPHCPFLLRLHILDWGLSLLLLFFAHLQGDNRDNHDRLSIWLSWNLLHHGNPSTAFNLLQVRT